MLPLLRHRIWMRLGEHAWGLPLFRAYKLFTGRQLGIVDRETDIVIEGYPRSGNTFALVAFQLAQPHPVRVAHHLHGPSQIAIASRLGIPVIFLIRDPVEAVASLVVRYPFIPIPTALRNYIRYHHRSAEYIRDVVVSPFERVVSSFAEVVEAVNRRYGTEFQVPRMDAAYEQKIFQTIGALDRLDQRSGQVSASTIARPSDRRRGAIRELKEKIVRLEPRALLERSIELHRTFVNSSDLLRGVHT